MAPEEVATVVVVAVGANSSLLDYRNRIVDAGGAEILKTV